MSKITIGIASSFLIVLSGCATFGEDKDTSMIPPSANYSPVQAPVYPPLKDPYTPNMLTQDNSRVMNIDRLNVGEANIPNMPQPQANTPQNNIQQPQNPTQNPSVDVYIKDQRNDYTPNYVAPNEVVPYTQSLPQDSTPSPAPKPKSDVSNDPNIIPNSPILTPDNTIELSAVGMGVAPESTISPSQALALAKRAAIIDAYRQIGEKMYGIRLNAQDTVRDMVLINSVVKTKVEALIKNAEIIETVYKDGLCQITMELKLDGKVWYKILSDANS